MCNYWYFIPFSLLRINSEKKLADFNQKAHISFKEMLVDNVVFFTMSSLLIILMIYLSRYFNINGQLVSSIGIAYNEEYFNNILYLIILIVITPILEEYAFRGVLLNCLSRYGKYFAVIASSLIYALAHGFLLEMIPSFIMGFILSKKELYFKSIVPTIIMHISFNLFFYIFLIISVKYLLLSAIIIIILAIITIILVLNKTYFKIKVKKSGVNNKVGILFLMTPTVLIALILFICHSIMTML